MKTSKQVNKPTTIIIIIRNVTVTLGRFLNNVDAPTPFLILAIFCRGLMGFGFGCAYTAMSAIAFQEFSAQAITVLSLSESFLGVGTMVAPVIGGGLYDVGTCLV